MLKQLLKNLKILKQYFILSYKTIKEYNIDAIYGVLVATTNLIGFPVVWFLLTDGGKKHLNTWQFPELVFLSLTLSLCYGFLDMLGFWDVWRLAFSEGRVVLTKYLIRPANFYIQLFGENFFLGDILRLSMYILIMSYIVINGHIELYKVFMFFIIFSLGFSVMFLLLLLAVNLFIAFDQQARAIPDIIWTFLGYASFPVDAVKDVAGFILHYIIPVAFIALIPAKTLFEGLNINAIIPYFLIISVLIIINRYLWKIALKRFEAIGG
jgi:ABC-type uncharacterized transport system permease subunit